MKKYISLFFLILNFCLSGAQELTEQNKVYSRADSLRGSLRPERTGYDVLKYHLEVKVEPSKKFISGSNTITFRVVNKLPVMQIDLFENMKIDSIVHKDRKLKYDREFNAVFVNFDEALKKGKQDSIKFYYHGNPIEAKNAPWDGGFVWSQDQNGDPWVGVAVQGTGASLWYPNKDHQSDEPKQAEVDIAVPNGLMNISNGRFQGKKDLGNGFTEWRWKVVNPINNYNIMINIGNYEHFSDQFKNLDLDYYVLPYNLEKAKEHFREVKEMMTCFYEKMGPYPFPEDGFKLIETPYLGMEHQSAVAYGNKYQLGYLGNDLSGTGIGLKWDYIIIHESGHEWYGNSITASDVADMWIQEGFTSYTEAIYIECQWGKNEAMEYLKGTRRGLANQQPIIGDYGVNAEGSGDMYFKGANLLNTIRSIYNNDELWWKTLKLYTQKFKHQVITTADTENHFNDAIKTDLKPVFEQYLRRTEIPVLLLKKEGDSIAFRWEAQVENFKMPVDVIIGDEEIRLDASSNWKYLDKNIPLEEINIKDLEFYVKEEKLASQ